MAGYKGHVIGGLIWGGLLLFLLKWYDLYNPELQKTLILLCLMLLGALFPDVDTDSKGQRLFYSAMIILNIALMIREMYKWSAILGFFAMLPAIGRHRGWTHTWWAMLLVPAPIVLLPMWFYHLNLNTTAPFYLAAVWGYLSHLVIDRKF